MADILKKRKRRKVWVYISGPYTRPEPGINVNTACHVWHQLNRMGYTAICPHWSHTQHLITPLPWNEWIAYDLHVIERVDCLLRLPGESTGADREAEYARQLGIPVFHSVAELLEYKGAWVDKALEHERGLRGIER